MKVSVLAIISSVLWAKVVSRCKNCAAILGKMFAVRLGGRMEPVTPPNTQLIKVIIIIYLNVVEWVQWPNR